MPLSNFFWYDRFKFFDIVLLSCSAIAVIQSISAYHSISESYINRKFSEYMGVSYVKYLTQLRINKVIELLNENLDIKDIYTTFIKAIADSFCPSWLFIMPWFGFAYIKRHYYECSVFLTKNYERWKKNAVSDPYKGVVVCFL